MHDDNKAPQREPEGNNGSYGHHDTTTNEQTEANKVDTELALRVDATRAKVISWLERITKWREKVGPEAELQPEFYRYHPAFEEISVILSDVFVVAEDDEIDTWATETLHKITRGADGNLRYAGKGKSGLDGMIDTMQRAALVAVQAGDLSAAGLASMQIDMAQKLKLILWSDDWPLELPLVVGIREAV
ncbi:MULTISPECIES: hypothetical protein [Rhodobacterales]|uniref:hypothetical protein n=1 Tax=Rhodobacterales TaxID=204455 RepID=UPI003735D6FB